MKNPEVSIIISTYNRDNFLDKTLTSLRLQTFTDFEVLVCDDGGTTGKTKGISESYNKYYPIRYFRRDNEDDYGLAANRNMGAKNSKGRFLFFLDGDMILLPQTVGWMHTWLTRFPWRKNKCHVVPEMRYHVNADIPKKAIINDFDKVKDYIIKGFSKKYEGISPGGGGMISREVFERIGGFDDILFSNLVLEDIEFIYRLESFLGNKTKKLSFIMYHQDNRAIRSDREIKSRHNEKLAREILEKKFKMMGFKFNGKRPEKDLEKYDNSYYSDLLDHKEKILAISQKLKKEVIERYKTDSDNKTLEKEYIENNSNYSPLAYILILNYNGKKWLDICLPSVMKTKYENFRILMIDNNSQDGSMDYMKQNYPDIEVLKLDKNYGYAEGNNKGIRYALKKGAQYIAVLNNDTRVDPMWLSEIVSFGEDNFDAGAMGPLILDGDGKKIQGPMKGFNQPTYIDLDDYNYDNKQMGKLVGCSILFKKKALEKVGYFDRSFFCYQEEFDWCQRALFHNFNLYHIPSSKIYHYGFKTSARKKNYIYYRMKYLFTYNEIKKHLKDPNKPVRKLLKFVSIKKYLSLPKESRNFFLYHAALINNIIALPKTYLRRKKDIKGY